MNIIYFISTNNQWGGSEYLWYNMTVSCKEKGLSVVFATKYRTSSIDYLASDTMFVDLNTRFSKLNVFKRLVNKVVPLFHRTDLLSMSLRRDNPCAVVISQGNNVGSEDMFQLCSDLKLKYFVITHLVAPMNYQFIDENKRRLLISGYDSAALSFFVSKQNKNLHEKLLGYACSNARIIFNPLNLDDSITKVEFPNLDKALNCAIVGRIEFYHKGIDIFLEVISQEKWRHRAIVFNFYGDGPHLDLLNHNIEASKLSNVNIHGHTSAISQIWRENHLLILPSRQEGQSVSLSEALACSRPVVATNVGGVAEWIVDNENGFLAKHCTSDAIDDAMERMWMRKHELQNIGIKANQSWSSIVPADPVEYINDIIFSII